MIDLVKTKLLRAYRQLDVARVQMDLGVDLAANAPSVPNLDPGDANAWIDGARSQIVKMWDSLGTGEPIEGAAPETPEARKARRYEAGTDKPAEKTTVVKSVS